MIALSAMKNTEKVLESEKALRSTLQAELRAHTQKLRIQRTKMKNHPRQTIFQNICEEKVTKSKESRVEKQAIFRNKRCRKKLENSRKSAALKQFHTQYH